MSALPSCITTVRSKQSIHSTKMIGGVEMSTLLRFTPRTTFSTADTKTFSLPLVRVR